MGASGMDSRRARGGETEAMDSRGQDNARYAKVTSDGKKGHKEGARGQAEARGGEGGERGREGARRGERGARGGREGARGGREGARRGREGGERGGRQTDDTVVTSVVVVNHSNLDPLLIKVPLKKRMPVLGTFFFFIVFPFRLLKTNTT